MNMKTYLLLLLCGILVIAGVVYAQVEPVVVDIDIKPDKELNPINVKDKGKKKGKTPVAILGSDTFDVMTVDPASVVLGDATALRCAVKDVNADGFADLECQVYTTEIGVECGDTEVSLSAMLTDGTPITGSDNVTPVGCKEPKGPKEPKGT